MINICKISRMNLFIVFQLERFTKNRKYNCITWLLRFKDNQIIGKNGTLSILFLLVYLINYITICKYGVICCHAYGVDIVTFRTGTTPFQKSRIDLLRFNPRFVLLPFVLGKPFSSFRTLSNLCIWAILCSLEYSFLW